MKYTLLKSLIPVFIAVFAIFAYTPQTSALEYQGRLIKKGTVGEDVRILQQCLLNMGFDLPVYGADGWYGTETEVQIKSYQASVGIATDGIVGPITSANLPDYPCDDKASSESSDVSYQNVNIDDIEFDRDGDEITIDVSGYTGGEDCYEIQDPEIEVDRDEIIVTFQEKVSGEICMAIANFYEREIEIDLDDLDLDDDEYTVIVNDDHEFEFDFEGSETDANNEEDESFTSQGSIDEDVLSSSDDTPSDTAVFSFKINVSPFGDPIYIPTSSGDAVDIEVINASTNDEVSGTPTISLSSTANEVDGEDGNEYWRLSSSESITIKVTSQPGSGDYYGILDAIYFTSNDVTDNSFTSFGSVDVRIGLDDNTWRSDVVTLLN